MDRENLENGLWDIEQLSKYLNMPKSGIYHLTMRGELPVIRIGKRLRFRKSEIDKYLEMLASEN